MTKKVFSPARLFGGIALILVTLGIIVGCTWSAGRGGLYFLIIAIPMFGVGLGMIFKPFRHVCTTCEKGMKRLRPVPFSEYVTNVVMAHAQQYQPNALAALAQQAPLPDPFPATYCVLVPSVCTGCGQSGTLQVMRCSHGKRVGTYAESKYLVEFGAGIDGNMARHLDQVATSRWQWTLRQAGFEHFRPIKR